MIDLTTFEGQMGAEALLLTGLDSAIIGGSECGRLVYSYQKTVQHLQREGMTLDEAVEWVGFNVTPLMNHKGGFIMCHELPKLS